MLNLPCLRKDVFLSLLEFIELEVLNSLSPGKVVSFSSLAVLRAVASIGYTVDAFRTVITSLS